MKFKNILTNLISVMLVLTLSMSGMAAPLLVPSSDSVDLVQELSYLQDKADELESRYNAAISQLDLGEDLDDVQKQFTLIVSEAESYSTKSSELAQIAQDQNERVLEADFLSLETSFDALTIKSIEIIDYINTIAVDDATEDTEDTNDDAEDDSVDEDTTDDTEDNEDTEDDTTDDDSTDDNNTDTNDASGEDELEQRYQELLSYFNDFEDEYDDLRSDYRDAVRDDDERDIERYERKLRNLDDDLDEFLDDEVDELIDDVRDANNDELEENLEDLENDIKDLRDRIKSLLNDNRDDDYRRTFVSSSDSSAVTTESFSAKQEPNVVIEPFTLPLEESQPESTWEQTRGLAWAGVGIFVLAALVAYLFAVLLVKKN